MSKQKNWNKVRRAAARELRAEQERLKAHHSALYRLDKPEQAAETRTVIGWDKEGRPIYREAAQHSKTTP